MGRHYSPGLRERVLERMRLGEKVRQVCQEFNLPRSVVYEWKEKAAGRPGKKLHEGEEERRDQERRALEGRIAELEGVIGRQALELDFFASALRRIEGADRKKESSGGKASGLRSAAGCSRKAN